MSRGMTIADFVQQVLYAMYKVRLDVDASKESSYHSKSDKFKEIVMENDLVYIYSESRVLEYRINGNTAYEGMLPKSTYLLIPGKSSGKFTTVNSDTVDTVQLR